MSDPSRAQQPGTKKHSIDDIIDHITADFQQSYDGQYIVLGSHPNQQVWPEYPGQTGQHMPVRNPVYLQQAYELQDRKIQDFPNQHGMFYQNTPLVRDGSGEVIRMVDVGNGNFVNVLFNPNSNPNNQIHQYISAANIHQDPSLNYVHYQQSTSSPSLQQSIPQHSNQTPQRDYGLFNNSERPNQGNHQLIENLVGNWLPNQSGTYSPFGNVMQNQSEVKDDITVRTSQNVQVRKPRMVAQVRPMRPSYSDVLAKSVPPFSPPQNSVKPTVNTSQKTEGRKQNGNMKNGKGNTTAINNKNLTASNLKRQLSSGSEGGGFGGVRRWISLDDLSPKQTNDDRSYVEYDTYNDESIGSGSDYGVCSGNNAEVKKEKKQKKKSNKQCTSEDKFEALNNHKLSGSNRGGSKRPLQINNNLQSKVPVSEKNVPKNSGKNSRSQDDNKKGNNNINGGNNRGVNSEEKVPSVSRISKGNGGSGNSSGGKRSQRSAKKRDGQIWFGVLCKRWQEQLSYYAIVFVTWFLHLIWDVSAMSVRLLFYLCAVSGETALIWLTWLKVKLNSLVRILCGESWFRRTPPPTKPPEPTLPGGLTINISLPATGEEAMKRLLACKGKDPYSILGVTSNCSDDDIKKYYKRQAVLVHPDKNAQPGAEEAFKILVHAFELIGEPERRSAYDRRVAETHQVEQAWSELSELLTQLHHKMEYAANTIRCTNCGKRHKRVAVQRPCYAARFCAQCKINHSAREGDIWAESWLLGFLWHYYACMEGAVYDITEWAACQADNLKHLKANSHAVQYRIVLGKQSTNYRNKENCSEPDLEEFLNNLYAQSGSSSGNSANDTSTSRQRRKGKRKK